MLGHWCAFGGLAFLVLMGLGGWGFFSALVIGFVIFAALGILLRRVMCRPMPSAEDAAVSSPRTSAAQETAPAAPEAHAAPATPAPAAAPEVAPTAAPETAQVGSTQLAGETELAERKGSWTYQSNAASEPETLTGARGGQADDLKRLKGVGPKLEQTLNDLGFYHFDQIAAWTDEQVAWVDTRLKFKGRIDRDGWIEQAKILAAGGETEFSKRSTS